MAAIDEEKLKRALAALLCLIRDNEEKIKKTRKEVTYLKSQVEKISKVSLN